MEKKKIFSAIKKDFYGPDHNDLISPFAKKVESVRAHESIEQSISKNNINSNTPFRRNLRRENRVTIEGLPHRGLAEKIRKQVTPFGSSIRIGNYEDFLRRGYELESIYKDALSIDLETKGLGAHANSIIQSAVKNGNDYSVLFAQQKAGFKLETEAPFLASSGFAKVVKGIDLTKKGEISNYSNRLKSNQSIFSGNVKAGVDTSDAIIKQVEAMVMEARTLRKPIVIQNPQFEIRQLDALFASKGKVNPLQWSKEYLDMASLHAKSEAKVFGNFASGKITKDEAFSTLFSNQKNRFMHSIKEAQEGGKVVDLQDTSRMVNALLQQKGIQPRTGKFGANTNIDYLSSLLLTNKELHEAATDLNLQEILSTKLLSSVRELESNGPVGSYTQKLIDANIGNPHEIQKTSLRKMMKNEYQIGKNPYDVRYFKQLPVEGFDRNKVIEEIMSDPSFLEELSGSSLKTNKAIGSNLSDLNLQKAKVGSLLFGGLLLGSSLTNFFTFSGRDDSANTIEGLKHGGVAGQQRQKNTSFGSGFRTEKFHQAPQGQEEQESATWKQLGLTGLGATGAYAVFKSKADKTRLNDLTYLGKLDPLKSNEALLGRSTSTAQDVMVAGIRRMENTMGGFGKAFGVGDIASFGMYDEASFIVDLTSKEGLTYARYMDQLLERKLLEEGIHEIMFKKGQLFGKADGKWNKIDGQFSLMKTVTNHDLNPSISSLAKSTLYNKGISNVDDITKQPFLIIGGKGNWKAKGDFVDGFIHETLSKPLKLLADPLEAIRELFPDFDTKFSPHVKKMMGSKWMPDLGLDGKELVQDWRGMMKTHGKKLATVGAMAYFGLGTLNWGAQTLAPDGTPVGDAGLVGVGAYAIKKAHETYARLSDITGLTSLRDWVDEKAPGNDGWQSTIGLTGAGALFGAAYGTVQDLTAEASSAEKYKTFLDRKVKSESFDGVLGKIFKGNTTKTGKAIRIGGVAGFVAALPYTIAGLGADSSASQLAAEYSGEKEVAVKKGRFWESGFTPWEGGEIDYYRPNWYAKLMSDAKDKTLNGESISPFTEAARAVYDPFWLEKARYHSQPYPITGPDGSAMGIFGPLYEASIGRIIKPVATMHRSVLPDELINNTEYDAEALLRKQWNASLEFMGLRGFAVKAIKENLTGSQEIFADPNEARSAKDIDSVVRDFYDLQIGGGILTSEALRRVFQAGDSFQKAQLGASINLNPLKNDMPSWMPGQDYVTDFKTGDPFNKVKDGYYRLPGAGFSTRFQELEGVNPEDYADIYKYKILADIGYGSKEFRAVKGRLQNRQLTQYEQDIFEQVQSQVEEKKKSEMNVRDPAMYDSMLGRYTAFVTDLARSNPVETLLPVSPAHKFLGPPSIEQYMDEQQYSKDYRSWANPVDDFILPAVSMTMNSLGMGGINMNDDQSTVDDYFDKIEYVKNSNLARDAQSKGDLRSADKYTQAAQRTYSGKNVYGHSADIASSMPTHERKTFNYFVGADVATKQKMIGKVNAQYRDAYQAQLDMQIMEDLERSNMNRAQKSRVLKDIKQRQGAVESKRKAEIQDAKKNMPGSEWKGWSPNTTTRGIKSAYMQNRARDYHDYQPRRTSRSEQADRLAAGDIPQDISRPASYTSHYTELNIAGIENALVVLRPGLDNEAKVNITVDRRGERNEALRSWGYIK